MPSAASGNAQQSSLTSSSRRTSALNTLLRMGRPTARSSFMALIIEHFAGAFPVWLSPVQAMVIPIADRHIEYAYTVMETLKAAGVRVEVDTRSERMNAKVRDAQMQKIPYMLVVGDKEAAEN